MLNIYLSGPYLVDWGDPLISIALIKYLFYRLRDSKLRYLFCVQPCIGCGTDLTTKLCFVAYGTLNYSKINLSFD